MKGISFGNYHSFDDWGLILTSKEIKSPEPKKMQIDIEGGDGVLDLTNVFGDTRFKNRSLSFQFAKETGTQEDFLELYSTVQNAIHGEKMKVILDDDPDFYYLGRVTLNEWKSNKNIGSIVIDVDAEPWKYKHNVTKYIATLCGKNLFDVDNAGVFKAYGSTMAHITNGVKVTCTTAGSSKSVVLKVIPLRLIRGKTVYFSFNATQSASGRRCAEIGFASKTGNSVSTLQRSTDASGTISVSVSDMQADQYEYLIIELSSCYSSGSVGDYCEYTNLQVEIGSATSFEAYDSTQRRVRVDASNLRKKAVPLVYCSKAMEFTRRAETGIQIEAEKETRVSRFAMGAENQVFWFTGNGMASIEYQEGGL